jgi:hypothetical protein
MSTPRDEWPRITTLPRGAEVAAAQEHHAAREDAEYADTTPWTPSPTRRPWDSGAPSNLTAESTMTPRIDVDADDCGL